MKGESDGRDDVLTNRGVARKCDLCAGTGCATPACIEACPTKAISLVDLEEFRQQLREARAAELVQSYAHLKGRK